MPKQLVPNGPPLNKFVQFDGPGYNIYRDEPTTVGSWIDGSDGVYLSKIAGYQMWFSNSGARALGRELIRVADEARLKLLGPGFTFRNRTTNEIKRISTGLSLRLVDRFFEVQDTQAQQVGELLAIEEWQLEDQQPPEVPNPLDK